MKRPLYLQIYSRLQSPIPITRNRQRLLVEEETIRIISARAADRLERRKYEEGNS